jgi:hypothetical protein
VPGSAAGRGSDGTGELGLGFWLGNRALGFERRWERGKESKWRKGGASPGGRWWSGSMRQFPTRTN